MVEKKNMCREGRMGDTLEALWMGPYKASNVDKQRVALYQKSIKPEMNRGDCEVLFSLSVCLSVCPAIILVFYFSAIRRDIDTGYLYGCTQFTNKIYLHRSKVKVTGTVHHITKTEP